ncbi:unnamed protein product [Schistosoma margrebowiei]|uniref:Uncharacterized protein n=1 Tax=Schistosoma margrebowiei TaxID=48269 RepID=A0A183N4I0_9TREM|nr:unnamed protein product [Schistosoma margrebowiei]
MSNSSSFRNGAVSLKTYSRTTEGWCSINAWRISRAADFISLSSIARSTSAVLSAPC